MTKNILCCEFNSDNQAQQAFNQVDLHPNSCILEFGEKNVGKIVLLAEVSKNFLALGQASIIQNPHKDLMPTYFKLLTTKVKSSLCIIESESLTELLKVVNFLLEDHSFQGLEIYRGEDNFKKNYALLCNGDKDFILPEGSSVSCKIIEHLNDFVAQEFF